MLCSRRRRRRRRNSSRRLTNTRRAILCIENRFLGIRPARLQHGPTLIRLIDYCMSVCVKARCHRSRRTRWRIVAHTQSAPLFTLCMPPPPADMHDDILHKLGALAHADRHYQRTRACLFGVRWPNRWPRANVTRSALARAAAARHVRGLRVWAYSGICVRHTWRFGHNVRVIEH